VDCAWAVLTSPAPPLPRSASASAAPKSLVASGRLERQVRAVAFVTMGKLCLLSEALAKRHVNVLVRELKESPDAAGRNNACVILCDLCIR